MRRPARQSPASRLAAAASRSGDSAALPVDDPPGDPSTNALSPNELPAVLPWDGEPDDIWHWAETSHARALQARLDDHFARAADQENLPIRTRLTIVLGVSVGLWGIIIGGIMLLLG